MQRAIKRYLNDHAMAPKRAQSGQSNARTRHHGPGMALMRSRWPQDNATKSNCGICIPPGIYGNRVFLGVGSFIS